MIGLNLLLLAAVVVLSLEIVYRLSFQRGFKKGRDLGWRDCLGMVTEAAETHARQEAQKQEAILKRMKEVDAQEAVVEQHAAGVAPWN